MSLQSSIQNLVEGRIDFEGQRLANTLTHAILIPTTVIAFFVGWALQSLQTTFYILTGGILLVLLGVILPWPVYNKHPVKWAPPVHSTKGKEE